MEMRGGRSVAGLDGGYFKLLSIDCLLVGYLHIVL